MAYSYKTSISFGLVYIPVTLHLAAKERDIGFNMIDKKTMSRVVYKKTCVDCDGKEVSQSDIVKGYQYDKNQYIYFEPHELEALKTKKDKTITIEQFAAIDAVMPLYYDKTYYCSPDGAQKAFVLLRTALQQNNVAGFAKTMLGSKEAVVMLHAADGGLLLTTLHFADEIQPNQSKDLAAPVDKRELAMAKTIVQTMTAPLDLSVFKNQYRDRLNNAIKNKLSGKTIKPQTDNGINDITNLMESLQASLTALNKKEKTVTAKKTTARKVAPATKPQTKPSAHIS